MKILLPGLNFQINFLLNNVDLSEKKVAILGANSIEIALKMLEKKARKIEIFIDDMELFLLEQMNAEKFSYDAEKINIKQEEYSTFSSNSQFDVIYAQNSTTSMHRNAIIKNVRKNLAQNGIFCVGEATLTKNDAPKSAKEFFLTYNISPLESKNFENYFIERGFKLVKVSENKESLDKYYEEISKLFEKNKNNIFLTESNPEKQIRRIKHDIDLYLKFGMRKYLTFKVGIFQV